MEISFIWENKLVKNFDFTRKDKEEVKSLDSWIGQVKRNDKRLYKTLIIASALIGLAGSNAFATTGGAEAAVSGLDKVGYTILVILQRLGYWGCLIGCFVEILKSLLSSGNKDIWKIFFKYLLIFAILYMLPWAFDLIREIFSSM